MYIKRYGTGSGHTGAGSLSALQHARPGAYGPDVHVHTELGCSPSLTTLFKLGYWKMGGGVGSLRPGSLDSDLCCPVAQRWGP